MITAAVTLLGYAALLAAFGPRILDRARWTNAMPRLAIATWFAMAASFLLAAALAGAAIVMPTEGLTGHSVEFIGTCITELQETYGEAGGLALVTLGAGLTWGLPGWLAASGVSVAFRTSRRRRELRRRLALTGHDRSAGVAILDSPDPKAYCLPGEGGLIVVTSAAVKLLDESGLAAVLAHERAHLVGRHHLLMTLAQIGRRALVWLPLFSRLPDRIGHLVELAADDAATRRTPRLILARTLFELAASRTPGEALAATGGDTVARIERLLDTPTGPGPAGIGSILGGSLTAIAMPVVITLVPVLTTAGMACCFI